MSKIVNTRIKTIRLHINLSEEISEMLDFLKEKKGKSKSLIINELIKEKYLEIKGE